MLNGPQVSVLGEAAEAEGAEAYLTGKRVRNCPYYTRSIAGKHWFVGWMQTCMGMRNSEPPSVFGQPLQQATDLA